MYHFCRSLDPKLNRQVDIKQLHADCTRRSNILKTTGHPTWDHRDRTGRETGQACPIKQHCNLSVLRST